MLKGINYSVGALILQREARNYHTAFCIIKGDFSSLSRNLIFLHPHERKYFTTLKVDKRRQSYLLGRFAGKIAVCELVGCDVVSSMELILIDIGVFEFPVVKSSVTRNIQISLSHCDAIGIALAFPEEHPMAIDIDKIDPSAVGAVKEQLTSAEVELISLSNLPQDIGCFLLWTMKEGLSKVLKTGLTTDFRFFEIKTIEKTGSSYLGTYSNSIQYKAVSQIVGDYICSIILPKNTFIDTDGFSKIIREYCITD